ncbi:MAG TPA: BamA/TamA family outer membrane protein [Thermoguttaceae bacterium]|nr:BamA/TamA family outer membrane protein [Thermoguttaceae bacterium]
MSGQSFASEPAGLDGPSLPEAPWVEPAPEGFLPEGPQQAGRRLTPPSASGSPLRGNTASPTGQRFPNVGLDSDALSGGADSGEMVVEVRVVGREHVSWSKLAPLIRTRAGRPLDLELIEEDVRRLNRSRLFVSVKTWTQSAPGGRVVIFEVVERPVLQYVKFVGNEKVRKKVLAEKAGLKPGDALDPFAVEEGRRKIEDYYRSHGFSNARVTIIEGNRTEDKGAIYLVNEGKKQRILWTRFEGNTVATDARLRTQIHSKPGFLWIIRGQVDRKEIEEDINRLKAYYASLGYFNAKIGREIEYDNDKNWIVLTFIIDEGPRYKVREIRFVGNQRFSEQELAEAIKLKQGQYFNQAQLQSDTAALQEKYGAIGYVFADIKPDIRYLPEPGQADLVYEIKEGDRYQVGRIDVKIGSEEVSPHTKISTVLNRLSLAPGDVVDTRELRASERRLRASGLFLIDPVRNIQPKIVFSPPDVSDEEVETAQPRRPAVRGQSPSPSTSPTEVRGQSPVWGEEGGQIVPPLPENRPLPGMDRFYQIGPGQPTAGGMTSPNASAPRTSGSGYSTGTASAGASGAGYGGGWVAGGSTPTASSPPVPSSNPSAGGVFANGGAVGPEAAGQSFVSDPAAGYPTIPPPISPQGNPPQNRASGPYVAESGPFGGFFRRWIGQPFLGGGTPSENYGAPSGGILGGQGGLFSGLAPGQELPQEPLRPLPIQIITEESRTGRIMLGVGVTSDAGVVGSVIVDEQNFDLFRFPHSWEEIRNGTAWRGAGQRFRLEAVPGTQVHRYVVSFTEPYFLDTDVSAGVSGYFFKRIYRDWREERLGGTTRLGYQFRPDFMANFTFRGEKVTLFDPSVPAGLVPDLDDALGAHELFGFRLGLAYDTRDNAFLPTEGHYIDFGFEQVVGSFQYPRGDVEMRKYFTLHQRADGSGRHVLSVGMSFAVTGKDTPIYDHYFAGGFSTLRGFDYRGAGPHVHGVSVGGHMQLLASAQYLFPITADDMLRGVVFCDAGTVEEDYTLRDENFRVSLGFGLRVLVPAMGPAPLAFDFAWPVTKADNDVTEVFSFFIGIGR